MNDKIVWLLNEAKKVEGGTLSEDILALESLGKNAGVRNKEYKNLLAKFNALIAKEGEVVESKAVEPKEVKKLDYRGIKMIGSLFYSSKDKYSKGFATADECAKHYNGE